MRGLVDEVEIELAVNTTKDPVGQFQDVQVPHRPVGHKFTAGMLDRLGGAKVAGTH